MLVKKIPKLVFSVLYLLQLLLPILLFNRNLPLRVFESSLFCFVSLKHVHHLCGTFGTLFTSPHLHKPFWSLFPKHHQKFAHIAMCSLPTANIYLKYPKISRTVAFLSSILREQILQTILQISFLQSAKRTQHNRTSKKRLMFSLHASHRRQHPDDHRTICWYFVFSSFAFWRKVFCKYFFRIHFLTLGKKSFFLSFKSELFHIHSSREGWKQM